MGEHCKTTKRKEIRSKEKFGGDNIMVWECFSGQGMGLVHILKDWYRIQNHIKRIIYPYAEENIPFV